MDAATEPSDGSPLLQAHEAEAALRFGGDLTRAGLVQRTTMDWSRGGLIDRSHSQGLNPTEAMTDARIRLDRAMDAIGPDFAGLLIDVCGYGKGLVLVEQERRWPARSAKIIVKLALKTLANITASARLPGGHAAAMPKLAGGRSAPHPAANHRRPHRDG